MRRFLLLLALSLIAFSANAFAGDGHVVASGVFVPGHTVRCQNSTCTVITDAGGANGSTLPGQQYLTELGITAPGTPLCINDALTNAVGGYHQLCFGAKATISGGTGGFITYNAHGGASPLPLFINLNGTNYQLPFSGGGGVVGPATTVIGDVVVWNNATGTLVTDTGLVASLLMTGPGSSTANDVPIFSNSSGNHLADSGYQPVALISSISALRSGTTAWNTAFVPGFYGDGTPGGGVFNYVSTDHTSADNGCTIFVDAANHRWYRAGAGPVLSVYDCGAKGNQFTDDTTAIQDAITVQEAFSGGGTVSLGAGVFDIAEAPLLCPTSVTIQGTSPSETNLLIPTGANGIWCSPPNGNQPLQVYTLNNFSVTYPSPAHNDASVGVLVGNGSFQSGGSTIENIIVTNPSTGIWCDNCTNEVVKWNLVQAMYGDAFKLSDDLAPDTGQWWFVGNQANLESSPSTIAVGLAWTSGGGGYIGWNKFFTGNIGLQINFACNGIDNTSELHFDHNLVVHEATSAIVMEETPHSGVTCKLHAVDISNNVLDGNARDLYVPQDGIGSWLDNLSFNNNVMETDGSSNGRVTIFDTTSFSITGNTFEIGNTTGNTPTAMFLDSSSNFGTVGPNLFSVAPGATGSWAASTLNSTNTQFGALQPKNTGFTTTQTCGSGSVGAVSRNGNFWNGNGPHIWVVYDTQFAAGTCSGNINLTLPATAGSNGQQVLNGIDVTTHTPISCVIGSGGTGCQVLSSTGGNPTASDNFVLEGTFTQ